MNIAELTGVIGGAAAVLTSGGALYVSMRNNRTTAANNMILSWESLAKERNEEIIKIRVELKEAYADCKQRIRDLDRAHEVTMQGYRRRIVELEAQVTVLAQQLAIEKTMPPEQ